MRILLINPDSGMTQEDFDARCHILQKYCGPDVELYMECVTSIDVSLDSAYEQVLAAPEIIKRAMDAEKNGYDAVVLYCFSDPALKACQEVVDIPVIGAGMAACQTAAYVSRQSGLLIMSPKRVPEKIEYLSYRGYMPSTVSHVAAISMNGADVWTSRDRVIDLLSEEAKKLMKDAGIQAVIIGCLSYLGVAEEISERIGIPVIDAGIAGVSAAESLVRQKLFTSKKAYPLPPCFIQE